MNITNLRKEMEEELVGNILPFWLNKMTDKVNGGFYGRISGTGILMPETEKGADGEGHRRRHGAQGHIAGGEPKQQEEAPASESDAPVQHQKQRAAAEDALAALELGRHREHVADDAEKRRKVLPQQGEAQQGEEPPAHKDRRHRLQHVAEDHERGVAGAIAAVEVGEPGVTAAAVPDILMVKELGGQDGPVEAAAEIRDYSRRQGDAQSLHGRGRQQRPQSGNLRRQRQSGFQHGLTPPPCPSSGGWRG